MSWKYRPVASSVVLRRHRCLLLPALKLAQMRKGMGERDALREENEVLSAVHLVSDRFVIRMCTRRFVVATGSA